MRIGYIYKLQAYPPRGGNHRHVVELVQGFLRLGHSVHVIDDPSMPGVKNYDSSYSGLKSFIKDIDILYVRIDARFIRNWEFLKICMALADNQPIIWEINAPANEALAYSWLGGKSSKSCLENENSFRRLRRWFHAFRKMPGIFLEERYRRRLAKNVSAAICVSSALGKYADEGLNIKDVMVLPNGGPLISEEEIRQRKNRKKQEGFTVLYSGSAMYPWQGLDYLSGAISIAEREASEIIFVLAVNQRSPLLPSTSNVVILEGLNRDELLDAICGADTCVALHPDYFWSKYGFHGSPMKLFEYMACMVPSVTSDLGQMHEIIRHNEDGVLCKNDPVDIFNKLIYLKDHPEQAAKIGRNGWERIQSEFNWKQNVQKTLDVFYRYLR